MLIKRGLRPTAPRLATLAVTLGLFAGCGSSSVDQATDASPASARAPSNIEASWDPKYLIDAFQIQTRSIEFASQAALAEASTDVVLGTFEGVELGVNLFEEDPNEHGGGQMVYITVRVSSVTKGPAKEGDLLKVGMLQASVDLGEFRQGVPTGTPVLLFGAPSEALRERGVEGVLTPFNSDALVFGDPDGSGFVLPLSHEMDEVAKLEALLPK